MTTPKFLATSIEEYNQHGTGILTNCGGDQLPTARSYVRQPMKPVALLTTLNHRLRETSPERNQQQRRDTI